jgi:hypothetical protein
MTRLRFLKVNPPLWETRHGHEVRPCSGFFLGDLRPPGSSIDHANERERVMHTPITHELSRILRAFARKRTRAAYDTIVLADSALHNLCSHRMVTGRLSGQIVPTVVE